ncbi:hypothetical protein [Streptomyces sp. NWU339]|uniref:hypothetical protein n=1 Tax=Streptomyces sp. NWU339 TaxID=2185284 RepID=UPI00215AE0FF|nr:hypothetical protein [Streptomyces sp. NWU339]
MIVSLVYQGTQELLSVPAVLLRRDTSRDAAPLVPRHEHAAPRRQPAGPARYAPADRFRRAALAALLLRRPWAHGLPGHPRHAPGPAPPVQGDHLSAEDSIGLQPGVRFCNGSLAINLEVL